MPGPQGAGHLFVDRLFHVSSTLRSRAGILLGDEQMNLNMKSIVRRTVLMAGLLAASATAFGADLRNLTICADPGNMPLSNEKGEGFENKIAEIIGKDLGTGVHYYWRPSIERGLMRTTLNEGNCDVWMDMATDTEGATVLAPLYRSTFVLAYRSDKGIHI